MLPHTLCQCQSAVLLLLQYPKLERMLHVGTIGLHIFKDSIQRDETQKDRCAPTNEHAKVVLALSLPSDAVVVTFVTGPWSFLLFLALMQYPTWLHRRNYEYQTGYHDD
ncbi:hypothetical protein TWF569_007783 [Orbilia oligospora]|uniref:Uncharacterized protein n=1 Tax=Orbilia oligospora TaxID=2813651 RepID=A0A7C8JCG5_ORBOL|nr:hypothetical protein TWF102_003391 [Orbilia oligospora]KAF3104678.1 hypothetical protein TWF706_004463 [Orbilia oligospora]KAF3115373.1 hypothetical protein TWF103_010803 [Orbilia oligospora]KAF3139701.1 hypothetical protein TWF594_006563 [Orbilia oligospora]KAF3141551.1 hypothetical protein TWF569_007783 [Orbilia oligospora]